jgi:Fur family zinc uptake transcriptional regulator
VHNDELIHLLERADALCRKRGVRLTNQRKTVLRLLSVSDKPLSAYELLDRMRSVVKNPTPPVVYRALEFLLQQGLIHKLETQHSYISCVHPEHPHSSQFLICDNCGQVIEIEDASMSRNLQAISQSMGFHAKRPVVELLGTCKQCNKK